MIRLLRIMSEDELSKYLDGKPLENNTRFEQNGSEGFCFFRSDEIDAITATHLLSGITPLEFMVEFMVEERTFEKMKQTKGKYHLPDTPLFEAREVPEYSITSYNRKDFFPYQIWRLYIDYPVFKVEQKTTPKRKAY